LIDYDPYRWRDHLLDIQGSMVRQIFARVLSCVLWSVVVVALHNYFQSAYQVSLAIPNTLHSFIGLALSLLLVFRTNAAYDRFWEARKLWGSIINETRNLGRAATVQLWQAPDLVRSVLGWTMAFPHAAMNLLRGDQGLGPGGGWVPREEALAALMSDHVPLAVARRISEQLAEARRRGVISDIVQMQLDQNVQLLVDYVGGCERIHRTPFPYAYLVHLRRALILYAFTLPFALVADFGWLTVLDTLLVAYILFGIEEIGVQIQDPFGRDDNNLPLERFCATIDKNLAALADTLPGDGVRTPVRDARP
jgi:ion channel-forming bestrophin family protein